MPPFSKEFYELARRLVPPSGPILERSAALVRSLRRRYSYSLETPVHRRGDPLEDFLFESRAGHCEYFATAMVMMLRSQGIPSRLVTGFQQGERNEVGGFEVVRKQDAHAWVEVFDPLRGWVAFDPTPSAPGLARARGFDFLSERIDSLRMFWEVYVIAFDFERQRGVLGAVGAGWEGVIAEGGKAIAFARENGKWLGGTGLLLLVGLTLSCTRWGHAWRWRIRLRWPFGRRVLGSQRPESAVRFYEGLLAGLERSGFVKPAGSTPAEFASAWEDQLPGLTELTRLYYRARFGGLDLDSEQEARAQRLIAAVQLEALSTANPSLRASPRTGEL